MSFTVRFATGVSVVYREASYMRHTSQTFELYTGNPEEGGRWVASIPVMTQCIIEARPASRVENTLEELTLRAAADQVVDNLRELGYRHLKELKMALKDFDARSNNWKVER